MSDSIRIRAELAGEDKLSYSIWEGGQWVSIPEAQVGAFISDPDVVVDIEVPDGEKGNPLVRRK